MIDPEPAPSSNGAKNLTDPSLAGRFEEALGALEAAVAGLQRGGRSLDEMLALFERGTLLASECEVILRVAELRVEQLLADAERPG